MSDFWARRKAAVQAEARVEEAAQKAAELADRDAAVADKSDDELLDELGLPDPDTLAEGDDFTAFLSDAVPARLKTRALRRLWRINPVLANLDGLVDYGEDFTDSAMVVENLQTAYQVGKGMMAKFGELADEANDAEDIAAADAEPAESAKADEVDPTVPAAVTPAEAKPAAQPAEPADNIAAPRSRRMQFHFEDQRTG